MNHAKAAQHRAVEDARRVIAHGGPVTDEAHRGPLSPDQAASGDAPIFAVLQIRYVRAGSAEEAVEIAAEDGAAAGNTDTGEPGHTAGALTLGPLFDLPIA
jgi:hypothetical protein